MKLNTNSNAYTIVYASVMVVVVAFILAFVSSSLRSTQEANVANDKRGQILSALNIRKVDNIEQKFGEIIIKDMILNSKGEVIDSVGGFKVEAKDITAKNDADKKLPLYVAKVDNDTVYGANYTHQSETAGLGARIVEQEFQEKFIGKVAFADSSFSAVVLGMAKEVKEPKSQVDMITGATLTCNGMDEMFKSSISPYKNYFIANHK